MCPIGVKKGGHQVSHIKYTDHGHQDFWTYTLALETRSKEAQDDKLLG